MFQPENSIPMKAVRMMRPLPCVSAPSSVLMELPFGSFAVPHAATVIAREGHGQGAGRRFIA